MITCSHCGNLYVECETQTIGKNLHTKIEDNNTVIITPEFYKIIDTGKDPQIKCSCKKLNIVFQCDFCGKVLEKEEAKLVENANGEKLVSCNNCVKGMSQSSKITDFEIDKLTFKAYS